MPNKLDETRDLVARANRMIANEGVLDAFGHVTMRHPTDPGRYLMSRSRAPELVLPEDIHEFTLDSAIVKPIEARLYGERVIHGEIYKARPEVMAICHHHAPSILPFSLLNGLICSRIRRHSPSLCCIRTSIESNDLRPAIISANSTASAGRSSI